MITTAGGVKLCDLGFAKPIQASEGQEDTTCGTPQYISPEQARGLSDVDIRADIYSLGATLYHMMTGRVPFPGPNQAVVMTRHLNDPLEPPDEVNPDLSRGGCQIVERMMAKERELRYQTPADLIVDLQAWLEGRLVVQPQLNVRSRRRFRRFR